MTGLQMNAPMRQDPGGVIDVGALIDGNPFSSYQRRVVLLCALLYLLDGYDTLAMGYTAPLLAQVVNAPLSAFGPIFSAGLFGATVGTLAFGVIGDRIGRKWALIAASAIFGAFSLATLTVTTMSGLLTLRFLTGLGLGGATPLFVAMATEFAPKRSRGLAMAVVYAAFPLGGVLGGLVSSGLVPRFGWQAVFVIGGLAPLAVAALLAFTLPESIRFVLARSDRTPERLAGGQLAARRILARMGVTGLDPARRLVTGGEPTDGRRSGLARVVAQLGLKRSALLWTMYFCVFSVLTMLSTWTPGLLRGAGVPLSTASLILAANSFGAVIGTIVAGHLFDRFGGRRMLLALLTLSAVMVALYGPASGWPVLLGAVAVLTGMFVAGASACMFALAGGVYSTSVRASGVGFALGFGRLGQVLGPLAIGLLLSHEVGLNTIFLLASVPCAVAVVATIAFGTSRSVPAAKLAV